MGCRAYARELYQLPGVADTVNMEHIKKHYCCSHKSINPLGAWSGQGQAEEDGKGEGWPSLAAL